MIGELIAFTFLVDFARVDFVVCFLARLFPRLDVPAACSACKLFPGSTDLSPIALFKLLIASGKLEVHAKCCPF